MKPEASSPDLGPDWGKIDGRDPFRCVDCELLRETIRRLNRRCQTAEAAANLRVEEWDKRSKGQGRAYVYSLGKRGAFYSPQEQADLCRWIVAALRSFVATHGPTLDGSGIGSAAKRVAAEIRARLRDEAQSGEQPEAVQPSKSKENNRPAPPSEQEPTP